MYEQVDSPACIPYWIVNNSDDVIIGSVWEGHKCGSYRTRAPELAEVWVGASIEDRRDVAAGLAARAGQWSGFLGQTPEASSFQTDGVGPIYEERMWEDCRIFWITDDEGIIRSWRTEGEDCGG